MRVKYGQSKKRQTKLEYGTRYVCAMTMQSKKMRDVYREEVGEVRVRRKKERRKMRSATLINTRVSVLPAQINYT